MIPYSRQTVSVSDAFNVARKVVSSSLTQGKTIDDFERVICEYVGSKYAVVVANATAALQIAVKVLKQTNDENYFTSPISFVASSNAALYNNLSPQFIDIDCATGTMDPVNLKRKIETTNVKGIVVPVHYSGTGYKIEEISKISREFNYKIIEDAAHSLGATYACGSRVGSCKYSDATIFSFHPVKSITTGEGGAITTNDEAIYKKLLRLRSHGINKNDDELINITNGFTNKNRNLWYYEMQELGFNMRLTEIQAALGISQMKKLNKFMRKRKTIAEKYFRSFENIKTISTPSREIIKYSANHLFPVKIDFAEIGISRNELMKQLRVRGILTQVHYIPINMQPFYQSMGHSETDTPNSLIFYNKILSLPIYPELTPRKQDYIIKTLLEIVI